MDYKIELEKAQFKLQAKLADFLRTGNTLYDIKSRIKPYLSVGNAQVESTARALDAQADGYLTNFRAMQAEGTTLIDRATKLKARLDATMVSVDGVPPSQNVLGTAFSFLTSNLGETAKLAADLGSIALRMDGLTGKVNDLSEAVDDMSGLASGQGFSARLSSVLSGTGETLQKTVYIAAVGAIIIFLGPYFLSGLTRQRWFKK